MTLDLRLARTAQVIRRDRDIHERVVAEDTVVRADDLAVLERERVQRASELGLGKDQRRGDVRARPARRERRASLQILGRQAGDERQAGQRRVGVSLEVRTVGDDGAQAVAEHSAKIGGQRFLPLSARSRS